MTDNQTIIEDSSKILIQRIKWVCDHYNIPAEIVLFDFCSILVEMLNEDFFEYLNHYLKALHDNQFSGHVALMRLIQKAVEKE